MINRPTFGARNWPFYAGLGLTAVFIFLALFGPNLAPHDPLELNRVIRLDGEWFNAPFRPGELSVFPLGTDEIGRDMLSRILFAVRPTLLLCLAIVAVRLSVGVVLGLLAGWYRGPTERIVDTLVGICLAIPLLVFGIATIVYLGVERGLMAFVVALSLTGWADTAALVKNQTIAVLQAPYIEGALAIGATPGRTLRKYVLPQLAPILPSLVAFELAAVMLLVAELGFLGIFIGGGFVYDVPDPNSSGTINLTTAGQPELGQLLSDLWARIILTPWVPFQVGVVVFLQIFAFNLLGEGLRRRLDVRLPRQGWLRRRLRPAPLPS